MRYLLLLFLVGCQPVRAPLTFPETLVWVDTYHQNPPDAPIVEWLKGVPCPHRMDLNAILEYCDSTDPYCVNGIQCNAGEYYPGANLAPVITESSIHESAMAHEFLHAFLGITTGDYDMYHTQPEWDTLLPQAVTLLTNEGF